MRWEDERWVKVYTRDTAEWLALGWEAQALFLLLLRKSDRAGLLHSGRARVRGLAALAGMPLEVVERALPLLLEDGCVQETDNGFLIPNFIAAQEAEASGAQRSRTLRERDRDKAKASGGPTQRTQADISARLARGDATQADTLCETQTATQGDTQNATQVVTVIETPRVDKSRVDKSREDLFPGIASAPPAPAKTPKAAKKREPTGDSRHAPLVKALTGAGWPFDGAKDAAQVKALLALADQQQATAGAAAMAEVVRRAAIAWGQFPGFNSARTLGDFRAHWGRFQQPDVGRGPAPPSDFEKPREYVEPAWLDPDYGKE